MHDVNAALGLGHYTQMADALGRIMTGAGRPQKSAKLETVEDSNGTGVEQARAWASWAAAQKASR